jgi:hypothetical protein
MDRLIVILVLLIISFAFFLFGRIVEPRRRRPVFSLLGIALCLIASILTWKTGFEWAMAAMTSSYLFQSLSDLIAIPISRRRVTPPCVRAKTIGRSHIFFIILSVVAIPLMIYLSLLLIEISPSPGRIVFVTVNIAALIAGLAPSLFEKVEVCGNGVWQYGRLTPWNEYESFCWISKPSGAVELTLTQDSRWIFGRLTLIVQPEDRETVHQLLVANLPNLSETTVRV